MINKIKAVFAAIGSIGLLMLIVSSILWLFTNYPGDILELCIISFFMYWGYKAYTWFLKKFESESKDKQINS